MKKIFLLLALGSLSISLYAQTINTIAGDGSNVYSGDGGSALFAGMNAKDVKMDAKGNIYVVDESNSRIRKIDTAGVITTFAGNGMEGYSGDGDMAQAAEIDNPNSVAIDLIGNVYIADGPNSVIRKVDTNGIITTYAGTGSSGYSGDGGPATSATLGDVYGVAVDNAGNVYIADAYNNAIRKVNTSGIISTIAGNGTVGFSGDGGPAINAQLSWPNYVITDNAGNVYIADYCNNRVRMVNPDGIITTIAGSGAVGTIPGEATGSYSGDGAAATAATLNCPGGLAISNAGNIYISDVANSRVRMIDTNGVISTVCGNGTQGYSGDGGPATSAEINQPAGLIQDQSGNLLLGDNGNARVRKFAIPSVVDTTTGIAAVNGLPGFGIAAYPNPNNGVFTFSITSATRENATVTIVNILGEQVKEFVSATNTATTIQLDEPAGIYFITAVTKLATQSARIIVW